MSINSPATYQAIAVAAEATSRMISENIEEVLQEMERDGVEPISSEVAAAAARAMEWNYFAQAIRKIGEGR